jgi:hypothetical protein
MIPMKKLLTAGALLLFATSSCIFVVSDSDCEDCRSKVESSHDRDRDSDAGDPIDYVDER